MGEIKKIKEVKDENLDEKVPTPQELETPESIEQMLKADLHDDRDDTGEFYTRIEDK